MNTGPPVPREVPAVVADQYGTTRVRLTARDRDHDRLGYYATDLPDGVTVDATTGLVTHPPDGGRRAGPVVHLAARLDRASGLGWLRSGYR